MKHTTRMLLVPEEMYRSLLSKAPSAAASVTTGAAAATDALGITPTTTPIEHIAKRMARVARTAQQPAARALMNDDERMIHYQQEYKRFKKLLADESGTTGTWVLRDALTEAAKTLQQPQQQQQTPPSLTKRRRRTAAAAAAAVPARAGVHSTPPVSPQPPAAATAAAPPQQHPERQQNKGTTGQKGKRKRTTTATTASSYTSAASGAEEEQQQQHQPQRLGEAEQRRKQQALDYTSRHAGTLGIGDAVCKPYSPIILHLPNNHNQQHHRLKPPPGYQTFIANAKQHPQLSHLLFPTSSTSSISGEGHGGGGGGGGRGGILTKRKSSNAAAVAITATKKARGKKIRGSGASSAQLLHTFKKAALERSGSREKCKQRQQQQQQQQECRSAGPKTTRAPNAAFTSVEPLLLEARRQHPGRGISRAEVRRYLARQRVYTLHRLAVRRFRRLPTLASGLHTDWQADLADFTALKRHNRGHAYLLVCADTLSRQLFVEPVKSKRSSDIVQAFEKNIPPGWLCAMEADDGPGQRVHRRPSATLFGRPRGATPLHAHLTPVACRNCGACHQKHQGKAVPLLYPSRRKVLDRRSYSTLPNEINFGNAERVRRNQLERLAAGQQQRQSSRARLPFRVGDRVRIEKHKHVFKKGYLPRFTDELFTVAEPPPPLRSKRDEPIAAKAGAADSATVGPVYDIERVLRRRRGRDGAEQLLRQMEGLFSCA
ncbi:hypothetical protein niasHT_018800 [Heterodera trifolii]|uniref:Integrase catalytic domain-containing protein n=1 Tax=Heterodera trifolii TaxID=157864 RepID=A0ABD2KYB9_9BILA